MEKTKLKAQAHIYCCEAKKAISFLDKEYSVILMDPPYSDPSIGNLVTQLATSKLVGAKTVLVATHSPRLTLDATYAGFILTKERRHGDSCINIYQKEGVL